MTPRAQFMESNSDSVSSENSNLRFMFDYLFKPHAIDGF